jgi:hypothetical protein
MSEEQSKTTDSQQPTIYQIKIEGHLRPLWEEAFTGLHMTLTESGETELTGPVVDQAALYGLLRKIRDLGLPLISVTRLEAERK